MPLPYGSLLPIAREIAGFRWAGRSIQWVRQWVQATYGAIAGSGAGPSPDQWTQIRHWAASAGRVTAGVMQALGQRPPASYAPAVPSGGLGPDTTLGDIQRAARLPPGPLTVEATVWLKWSDSPEYRVDLPALRVAPGATVGELQAELGQRAIRAKPAKVTPEVSRIEFSHPILGTGFYGGPSD